VTETHYLTLAEVLDIARRLLGPDLQVRDAGLLMSAITRPQMSAFGADAYPTVADKAAAMLHSLARNHCVIDGNKRLAWVCARVFAADNGHDLRAPSVDEGEALVLSAARGELDAGDIAQIIGPWLSRRASEHPL
jgi:death-on-curing protein